MTEVIRLIFPVAQCIKWIPGIKSYTFFMQCIYTHDVCIMMQQAKLTEENGRIVL